MKRLLLYILLLVSVAGRGQVDYFTMTMPDGSLVGMVEHIAPANPNGSLNPWIVWVAGQEGNGSNPANANDTTRIDNVVLKGTTKLVINGPLPYFQIPGTVGASGLRRFNVIAAQNPTGLWDCNRIAKCFERIRTTYASTTDTSLIAMFGYSLGGGGIQSCLRMSNILPYVDYVAIIAPGYTQTADFATLASSRVQADMFAVDGDQLAPPTGSGRADFWVSGLKAANPKVIPSYIRLSDLSADNSPTDHNLIVQIIVEDTIPGESYALTNGDTWTREETIYHRALRFGGARRKTASFPVAVLIPGLFKRRRRAA